MAPANMAIGVAPGNFMVQAAPTVRDVGAHEHDWHEAGRDGSGEVYRECSVCGSRSVASGRRAYAIRQDWLAGGAWSSERPKPAEPKKDGEAFAFRRKRGRPRKTVAPSDS